MALRSWSVSVGLYVVLISVFSFPDNNLSKCQWIFIKFGVCIDIVEVRFEIANGQILTELSARDKPIFSFLDDNE